MSGQKSRLTQQEVNEEVVSLIKQQSVMIGKIIELVKLLQRNFSRSLLVVLIIALFKEQILLILNLVLRTTIESFTSLYKSISPDAKWQTLFVFPIGIIIGKIPFKKYFNKLVNKKIL